MLIPEDGDNRHRKGVEVLVQQRDFLYERWCFQRWFNEGKISMNVIRGMYYIQDNVPSKCLAMDKIISP